MIVFIITVKYYMHACMHAHQSKKQTDWMAISDNVSRYTVVFDTLRTPID